MDIAIIDTGIGPVGGDELNVAGGVNCAADGLAGGPWQDLYEAGHGTHVAGTIGARDGNGVGVVGVAPGARLWAVRVFDQGGCGRRSHGALRPRLGDLDPRPGSQRRPVRSPSRSST